MCNDAGQVMNEGKWGRLSRDKVMEKDLSGRTNEGDRHLELEGGAVITPCMFKQSDSMSQTQRT